MTSPTLEEKERKGRMESRIGLVGVWTPVTCGQERNAAMPIVRPAGKRGDGNSSTAGKETRFWHREWRCKGRIRFGALAGLCSLVVGLWG